MLSATLGRLRRPAQAGFSMLEALVAILVLSFGVLALAGLQWRVLSESLGAGNRHVAVQLAGDMADRIRANPVLNATSDRRHPYLADGSPAAAQGPEPSCAADGASCNAGQLAAHDLWTWKRAVAAALPGGLASINGQDDAGGLLFLHVAWNEPGLLVPIPPDPSWQCPPGTACLRLIVAVRQP